jgi:Flp pilus assembly protein TadG
MRLDCRAGFPRRGWRPGVVSLAERWNQASWYPASGRDRGGRAARPRTGSAPSPDGPNRRDRGQGLTEFALVLPILAILLFGIIQFGIIFGGYNALINSVRETARYGSVCVGQAAPCGQATADYASTKIKAAGFAYAGAPKGEIQYQAYQEPTGTGQWNVRMQVTACVGSIIFIPLIGNIINSSAPSEFPLKSVETFRVEGNPTTVASTDPDIPAEPAWTDPSLFTFGGGGC